MVLIIGDVSGGAVSHDAHPEGDLPTSPVAL
jgi:hypothetical protein